MRTGDMPTDLINQAAEMVEFLALALADDTETQKEIPRRALSGFGWIMQDIQERLELALTRL